MSCTLSDMRVGRECCPEEGRREKGGERRDGGRRGGKVGERKEG